MVDILSKLPQNAPHICVCVIYEPENSGNTRLNVVTPWPSGHYLSITNWIPLDGTSVEILTDFQVRCKCAHRSTCSKFAEKQS